jgi:transketolase
LDNKGVQLDGTLEQIMPMGDFKAKWELGWDVLPATARCGIDLRRHREAKTLKGKSTIIFARTQGQGRFLHEGKNTYHGKP